MYANLNPLVPGSNPGLCTSVSIGRVYPSKGQCSNCAGHPSALRADISVGTW